MYVPQEFPKWKWSVAGQSRIVKDRAEEAALGPGWFDTRPEAEAAAAPVAEDPLSDASASALEAESAGAPEIAAERSEPKVRGRRKPAK